MKPLVSSLSCFSCPSGGCPLPPSPPALISLPCAPWNFSISSPGDCSFLLRTCYWHPMALRVTKANPSSGLPSPPQVSLCSFTMFPETLDRAASLQSQHLFLECCCPTPTPPVYPDLSLHAASYRKPSLTYRQDPIPTSRFFHSTSQFVVVRVTPPDWKLHQVCFAAEPQSWHKAAIQVTPIE